MLIMLLFEEEEASLEVQMATRLIVLGEMRGYEVECVVVVVRIEEGGYFWGNLRKTKLCLCLEAYSRW